MNNKTNSKTLFFWMFRSALIYLFMFSAILSAYGQTILKEKLEQHVYTLASDEMQGRRAGTRYARMAADYIVNQFVEIGIDTFFDDSYLQFFFHNRFQNVVGVIHGNDPVLKNEYIIVGAHFDHVGSSFGRIGNGADDNASGVAAMIELGRELLRNQSNLKRSVILIAFDAEEMGLVGSTHFIDHWEAPLENIKLMVSLDMVGWYQASGMVEYAGSGTMLRGNEIILDPQIIPEGLNVVTKNFESKIFLGTDTHPFAVKRIPTIFVSTGLKSPFHTSRDEAHLIDYNGMTLIVEHLANFIEAVSQDEDFRSSGRLSRKHKPRQLVDFGVSFINGTSIYDYFKSEPYLFFGTGLMTQLNFGSFAVRLELFYSYIRETHSFGTMSTNNLTIPLNLVLQTPDHYFIVVDIFYGGYYSYRFSGKLGGELMDFDNTFNRGEFGITFGLSYTTKPFKLIFCSRIPLTDIFQSTGVNNGFTRKIISYNVISFTF